MKLFAFGEIASNLIKELRPHLAFLPIKIQDMYERLFIKFHTGNYTGNYTGNCNGNCTGNYT